jgi:hypothetical protein
MRKIEHGPQTQAPVHRRLILSRFTNRMRYYRYPSSRNAYATTFRMDMVAPAAKSTLNNVAPIARTTIVRYRSYNDRSLWMNGASTAMRSAWAVRLAGAARANFSLPHPAPPPDPQQSQSRKQAVFFSVKQNYPARYDRTWRAAT